VLFTIHQPASEIFSSFDHLILLNKGRIMYEGNVSNVPAFFAMHDYPMPPNYNPADWIMMVAQMQDIKELESAGFFPKDERPLTEAFEGDQMENKDALGNTITRASVVGQIDERHVTQMTEFVWLMRREIIAMKRDKMFLIARFIQATIMSLLIGVIFLNVGERDPNEAVVSLHLVLLFGQLILPRLPAHSCPSFIGSSKYLWGDCNEFVYGSHGMCPSYSAYFPARASSVPPRVFDQSLFCISLLYVAFWSGSLYHCHPSAHYSCPFILSYWLSSK